MVKKQPYNSWGVAARGRMKFKFTAQGKNFIPDTYFFALSCMVLCGAL